ncbi:MAG: hypothetical protein JW910_00770 [Anaerolineae bacterium]|nr:hypothetical protein [Anaerolineae bacterium]
MSGYDAFQLLSLIVFLVLFLGRTFVLARQGVSVFVLGAGKRGFQRGVELLFFVGLVAWIIEVAVSALPGDMRLFPAPLDTVVLDSAVARLVGSVLILIGFVFFVLALQAFGRSWRVGIDTQTPGALVTAGIFSVSRNPIFVFIDLYFAGAFLITGTLILLLFAVGVIVGIHYQVLQEERFLGVHYGAVYTSYRARVGRYVTLR